MVDINKIEIFIIEKLRRGLDPKLTYHGVHHTLDVVRESMRIAQEENITDPEALKLLYIAALFHDSGFLYVYKDHELKGCQIASEFLPAFGINAAQLELICGMIKATRIPQSPQNILEQILCDADLDYLGREDFFPIAKTLYIEWRSFRMVKDEEDWNQKQVRFLEMHHYFTRSSVQKRAAQKAVYLESLKSMLHA